MNKLFSHLIAQFREFYRLLTPVKRFAVIGSALIVIIAAAVVSMMMTGSSYAPLFTNIPSDQMPMIVDQLQKKNIPFRISEDGNSVLIAKDLLHATQMTLMTEMAGAKLGQVGLELFDKQDFGMTS